MVPSELVKSYRVSTYTAGEKPVVRLEILLREGVEPRMERTGGTSSRSSSRPTATPMAARAAPAAAKPAPALTPVPPRPSSPKSLLDSGIQAIETVKLGQNGEQTEVNVVGSGKLNYHVTRLQNPDRLVLDFSGSHLAPRKSTLRATSTRSVKSVSRNFHPKFRAS